MIEILALILVLVVSFQLRNQFRRLQDRIAALERKVAASPPAAAAPRQFDRAPEMNPRAAPLEPDSAESGPIAPNAPAAGQPDAAPAEREASIPPIATAHAPAIAPRPLKPSLEERFGTRWVVWVGGIALALGGIFLVRYSIEQGLIGPGARTFSGGLLALVLLAGGEWMRRKERAIGFSGIPTAHIPSILTAAGTTVAYATIYAAYALYGFLSPPFAFLLLGVVALATLAASLLHGPALAALGLVGAEVTPLLVGSEHPNFWALHLYIAVVTAASFSLARIRLWRWLAITAVIGALLWTLAGIDARDALAPNAFAILATFALTAALIVSGILFGPPAIPNRIDGVSSGALIASLFTAHILTIAQDHHTLALTVFAIVAAATVAIAWRTAAAAAAVPGVAVLTSLVVAAWPLHGPVLNLVLPGGPAAGLPPEPSTLEYGMIFVVAAAFAALLGVTAYLIQGRVNRALVAILWAASGVFAPIAIIIALYARITAFERSLPFAGLALLLAALFAVATESLADREPRPGAPSAGALFATGALAALALALTFSLEKGWLTIALALTVPGTAWVALHRPVPFLRWLAAIMAVIVVARIGWEPRIVGRDVGATPIFNWLLYGYGAPALAFWIAGHFLRKRGDDAPARVVESGAILFTVLAIVLQIRHYMTGGDIYSPVARTTEVGMLVSAGLALTIGLEWVRGRTNSIVHDAGALIVGGLTLGLIAFNLIITIGPRLNNNPVGGAFFNAILISYGVPAVLAIVLALVARRTRPMAYRAIAATTAVALALTYLSLQVARVFRGPVLWAQRMTDAEQYTHSAAWLAFGIVLLAVGFTLRSKPARLASAAVITLTVAKVFLIDMANLTGIWRALSFIGLGFVLVAIGYVYQRFLIAGGAGPAAPSGSAQPAQPVA